MHSWCTPCLSFKVGITPEDTPYQSKQRNISISHRFSFNASLDPLTPNIILASCDDVYFVVHRHRLIAATSNGFAGLLSSADPHTDPADSSITFVLPEPGEVLNVLLHSLYDLLCDPYAPSLNCLERSLQAMQKYGFLPLQQFLTRGRQLYNTFLNHAPIRPLETYSLSAAYDLEDLTVDSSAYTLHLKLHISLTPPLVQQMGSSYLNMLYKLHNIRMDILKGLLNQPIFPHVAKPHCSAGERKVVDRAYRLACAQVFYDATPGELVSPSALHFD